LYYGGEAEPSANGLQPSKAVRAFIAFGFSRPTTKAFRLFPFRRASSAMWRCNSGGIRTIKLPENGFSGSSFREAQKSS